VKIAWKEICKFLAGATFVNAGILFYLYLTNTSVPVLGTDYVVDPQTNGPNNTGNIEIFWGADGWWWWSRARGYPPEGSPIGPFLTSTEAYLDASGGAPPMPRPTRLYKQDPIIT